MFQRKVLAMIAIAFTVGTAQAAEKTGSEFFFQTGAGKSDVTAKLGYEMLSTTAKGSSTAVKTTGIAPLAVSYEYGINEMFAVEGTLGYGSLTTDTKPETKTSGLINPEVTLKGASGMGFGNLHYGATLGLGGLQKAKVESNGDQNLFTGGYNLAPFVGIDTQVGPGLLGAKLTYDFKMERTIDNNGTDVKKTGGDELQLSAFYEYMLSDMVLGAAYNYRSIAEETSKAGGNESKAKSHNISGISLWSRIPVAGFDLIPRLNYDFSNSEDTLDKYSDMNISVAARFGF